MALVGPGAASCLLAAEAQKSKLKKAVKFDMIRTAGSIQEKFELIKSLGFQGVELDSPSSIDRKQAVAARDETGIEIHGVVDSIHWNLRLSDSSAEVRAKGVAGLRTALDDAKFYGASTVLLVPGKVSNREIESWDQVWERSQQEIRKVIPLAVELGVRIAIEVVGNDFITTPEQFVKYVDQFENPIVGAYFDVSNVVSYEAPPAAWIRTLGKRMLKFDFKGYSKSKGPVPIGEGDEDWPAVRKALAEVGYHGWATAETGGGGERELKEIAQRMNRVLELS